MQELWNRVYLSVRSLNLNVFPAVAYTSSLITFDFINNAETCLMQNIQSDCLNVHFTIDMNIHFRTFICIINVQFVIVYLEEVGSGKNGFYFQCIYSYIILCNILMKVCFKIITVDLKEIKSIAFVIFVSFYLLFIQG